MYHVIATQGLGISPLEKLKESILIDILKFTLGVCIEFRKGEISYKEKKDLEQYETLAIWRMFGKENQKDSYLIKFIDSYKIDENQYTFYRSIYETVTGGNIFDINRLRQELRKKHHVIDDNIPIHYEIYNKVLEHDYLKFADREYRDLLRKLKKYAAQGLYQIQQYPTILYTLLRDDNPLYLSEERLVKQFIRIVNKMKDNHKYNPLLAKHFSYDPENPFNKSQETLINAILKINKDVSKKYENSKIKDLKQLFVKDFEAFFQQFLTFHYQKKGYFSFKGFTTSHIYITFIRMSNAHKQDFVNLLYVGYLDTICHLKSNEIDLFTDLKEKVDNKLAKNNPRSNSTMLYKKLQEVLGEILISKRQV